MVLGVPILKHFRVIMFYFIYLYFFQKILLVVTFGNIVIKVEIIIQNYLLLQLSSS